MNPYAPPTSSSLQSKRSTPRHRAAFWKILLRWSAICVVSAIPSFFWGCSLHHQPKHIAAMTFGIAVFVAAYTLAECSATFQKLLRLPYMRRTLMFGYGTRLAISVIFPIGVGIDVFAGMISVSLVEGLGSGVTRGQEFNESTFLAVFLTTIVQGILLNLILFAYMTVIYSVSAVTGQVYRIWATGGQRSVRGAVSDP